MVVTSSTCIRHIFGDQVELPKASRQVYAHHIALSFGSTYTCSCVISLKTNLITSQMQFTAENTTINWMWQMAIDSTFVEV